MNAPIYVYRLPETGDEHRISACMRASAHLSELTDGTPESITEWETLSSPEKLRQRILSRDKTLVATRNGTIVGFIAFRRGNHLSLLFVRREDADKGIGRELFTRCINSLDEITVNSSDLAVGFYRKVGFAQSGARFFNDKDRVWLTPMIWTNKTSNLPNPP